MRRALLQDVHGAEKSISVCEEMRKMADLQTAGNGFIKILGSRAWESAGALIGMSD